MSRLTALSLVLVLAACGDDPPPASVAPPASAPPTSVAPPPPSAPPTTTTTADHHERAPVLDAAQARAYQTALRAARAAHHDGHDDEAVRQYQAALAISNDGRALCELGWIHFEAERYDEARTAMTRALTLLPAESPVPERFVGAVGACFYNLGRLEEQAGHVDAARASYQRSLAVRPGNAVVTARLASLGAAAVSASAPSHLCSEHGAPPVGDLAAWVTRVSAIHGPPEAFDDALAELSLRPFDGESLVDYTGEPIDPSPSLDATVTSEAMHLPRGAEGRLVHVAIAHEGNTIDRVAVLRAVEGGHCVVGVDERDVDACSTSCLTDGPAYAVSLVPLVAPDVDALMIDTSSGGCACGSERGADDRTRYLGVEGDALVTYLEATRFSAWYDSPWPPTSERRGEITLSDAFPVAITVETTHECDETCGVAAYAARQAEIDAAEGDEADELRAELQSDCGYDPPEPCEGDQTVTYTYRGGRYTP